MANRLILNETSYHGKGAIQNIVHEVTSRSFKKALVVTDKDLIKFNVAQKVTALLDAAGLPYEIFDEVKANPAVDVIKAGVAKFKASSADYLIAIGGGSPIDSAKAIGIIINNPEFSDVLSLKVSPQPTKNVCRLSPFQLPQVQPQKSRLTMSLPMKRKNANLCAWTFTMCRQWR